MKFVDGEGLRDDAEDFRTGISINSNNKHRGAVFKHHYHRDRQRRSVGSFRRKMMKYSTGSRTSKRFSWRGMHSRGYLRTRLRSSELYFKELRLRKPLRKRTSAFCNYLRPFSCRARSQLIDSFTKNNLKTKSTLGHYSNNLRVSSISSKQTVNNSNISNFTTSTNSNGSKLSLCFLENRIHNRSSRLIEDYESKHKRLGAKLATREHINRISLHSSLGTRGSKLPLSSKISVNIVSNHSNHSEIIQTTDVKTNTRCFDSEYCDCRDPLSNQKINPTTRTTNRGLIKLTSILQKFLLITFTLNVLSSQVLGQILFVSADTSDFEPRLELEIAEVFNKVAYGSSTTKRSIPDNWGSSIQTSTLPTPILTTFKYRDSNNDEWARVDVDKHRDEEMKDKEIKEIKEHRHQHKNHHHHEGSTRHNLQHDIKTYPETRKPISLLDTNPNKYGASTRSSYNLLRNSRPTPPMRTGFELPSYSPPSRAVYTPLLPPNLQNSFADKPVSKVNDYLNRRPGSFISARHPPAPPAPQSKDERRLYSYSSADGTKKKSLNTPTRNINFDDKIGLEFVQTRPNNSGFEYDYSKYDSSASRIFFGPNGHKEPIPEILRRVTAPTFGETVAPKVETTTKVKTTIVSTTMSTTTVKIDDDDDDLDDEENGKGDSMDGDNNSVVESGNSREKESPKPKSEEKVKVVDETTPINLDDNIQNLANVNRDGTIFTTKSTNYVNSTSRDALLYTWSVCWNLHIYLTSILYTVLAVYSIYKMIRFDKQSHLFSQGYFIIVHLLLITICVSRIFYLIYDPYNINLSFHKFISDIFLNLPLSLLAIAFATLYCHLLKRTLNSHFKVKPILVIIFSFLHIFLCIILHLIENFDMAGYNNNIFSLICQFIYILICLFLGGSYLYLYKMIRKVLAKKSQNFSELSIHNLNHATLITIAIALVFVLMSLLQIYGIFGLRQPERFSNLPPYKWLEWGFQFAIRIIEISIIALLSWVVSIKLSTREKTLDSNFGGFALFPCANSSSTVDNEIYPAVCQANQNVHNFTLRSGKNIYDENNYPLNDALPNDRVPIPERPGNKYVPEQFGPNVRNSERNAENFDRNERNSHNFERTYERTSQNRTTTPGIQDRNAYERSSTLRSAHLPYEPKFDNFDNFDDKDEDHYENPDFELDTETRRSRRYEKSMNYNNQELDVDACSVTSRTNSVNIQKSYNSSIEHDPNSVYNEPIGSEQFNFQNFERPNFERPTSRTNSNYSSRQREKCPRSGNSSGSSGNSVGTFERRSLRKSGTLNDFNNGSGTAIGPKTPGNQYHRNGVQTLNSVQKVHTYGQHGNAHGQQNMLDDELSDSMLVDENGFVRFRNLGSEFGKAQFDQYQKSGPRRSGNKTRDFKNRGMFNS